MLIYLLLQHPIRCGTAAVRDHRDPDAPGCAAGHILRLSQ